MSIQTFSKLNPAIEEDAIYSKAWRYLRKTDNDVNTEQEIFESIDKLRVPLLIEEYVGGSTLFALAARNGSEKIAKKMFDKIKAAIENQEITVDQLFKKEEDTQTILEYAINAGFSKPYFRKMASELVDMAKPEHLVMSSINPAGEWGDERRFPIVENALGAVLEQAFTASRWKGEEHEVKSDKKRAESYLALVQKISKKAEPLMAGKLKEISEQYGPSPVSSFLSRISEINSNSQPIAMVNELKVSISGKIIKKHITDEDRITGSSSTRPPTLLKNMVSKAKK
ncbi:MAG: hypothetical protein R3D71_03025 [Rickettsiales bacterium]